MSANDETKSKAKKPSKATEKKAKSKESDTVDLEKLAKSFGDLRSTLLRASMQFPDNERLRGAATQVNAAFTAYKLSIQMTG
jgi:hypothetical protein